MCFSLHFSVHLPVSRLLGKLGKSCLKSVSAALDEPCDAITCGATPRLLSALRMTITVRWWLLSTPLKKLLKTQSRCCVDLVKSTSSLH